MDALKQTVQEVAAGYAGKMLNGHSYLTQNAEGTLFIVMDVINLRGQHYSNVSLILQLIGDKVVVERDQNDKIVLDALLQAGLSRSQIILAYAGESIPEIA